MRLHCEDKSSNRESSKTYKTSKLRKHGNIKHYEKSTNEYGQEDREKKSL